MLCGPTGDFFQLLLAPNSPCGNQIARRLKGSFYLQQESLKSFKENSDSPRNVQIDLNHAFIWNLFSMVG